jgi:hypothetical protein
MMRRKAKMSIAQRRATNRYRDRRRKRGLRRVEVQVPAEDVDVIRRAAAVLRGEAHEASRLRTQLGFEPESGQVLSALDVFAVAEPLSPDGERIWNEVMEQVERDRRDPALNRARDIDP